MILALVGLIFLLAVTAGIAAGMAFLLDVAVRGLGLVVRSLIAALCAGFVPMIVPVTAILNMPSGAPPMVAIAPLIIAGVVMMLLVGFPAAYFVSRRRQRARGAPIDPETFE